MGLNKAPSDQAAKTDDGFSFAKMLGNVPGSAYEVGASTVQAIAHPIETAKAVYNLGWDGFTDYLSKRYGSVDAFLNTLEKDPVGTALDVSTPFTVGGLAARAPGIAGKLGRASAAVGRYTDPIVGASKVAGATYRGGKKFVQGVTGRLSTAHLAPQILAETAYESAYQLPKAMANKYLGTKFAGTETQKPQIAKGHLRNKRPATEGVDKFDIAEKLIDDAAQARIDARLAPLYADKNPFSLKKIDDALEEAYQIAHTIGDPEGSGAAAAVYRKMRQIVDKYHVPPIIKRLGGKITKPVTAKATDHGVTAREISDLNKIRALWKEAPVNPDISFRDYIIEWDRQKRSPYGLDRLKRQLEKVYPRYKSAALQGEPDALAQKVAAKVVNSVKDTLRSRFGDEYDAIMREYGDDMRLKAEVRQMFGFSKDTISRRLTSAARDTVFTDFGARLDTLKRWEKRAGEGAKLLGMQGNPAEGFIQIAGGRTAQPVMPRGIISMTSGGAGLALGFGAGAGPAGIIWGLLHMPRIVGEASYALGKAEGLIAKPLLLAERAMRKIGITTKGIGDVAAQSGRLAEESRKQEMLRTALRTKAEQLGYKLHDRVLNKLAQQLSSEDPKVYLGGLKTISSNKRIEELIKSLGE